jgi:thiamine-monophosphate kinase
VLLALGYDEHRPVESVRQYVAVAFLLALESAMRLGEICALRWEHIQASRGYLTLVDSKNADRRDVPLSRRAVALLGKLGELKLTGPQQQYVNAKLNRPQPRLSTGAGLRNIASSCIDISDGLTSDLGHILEQSGLGATVYVDQLPISDSYHEVFELAGGWTSALSAGDDYELCFTMNDQQHAAMTHAFSSLNVPVSCIGMVETIPGLRLQMPDGTIETSSASGYEHFT